MQMWTKRLILCFLICLLCSSSQAALNAAIVWEIRTTGAQTNGGGFKTGASGTDYSQQAAAQYALTSVSSGGATAVMTHADAAAVMVGNVCQVVSGTNATVGWYEIVSVNVGTDITVDRNWCTGACADGVVNVGGAWLLGGTLDKEFTSQIVAGNTLWVASGSYTMPERVDTFGSGGVATPILWTGYTSVRGDATIGSDRPLLTFSGDYFRFGAYNRLSNLRFSCAHAEGIYTGDYSILNNCKATNTSNGIAFFLRQGTKAISCEASSVSGIAFNMEYASVVNCYAHDSPTGFNMIQNLGAIINSIADTCTTGIVTNNLFGHTIVGNTIYGCTTGISGGTSAVTVFVNNIVSGCTTGLTWSDTCLIFVDYNCWNNTTDVVNVTKGPHAVTGDPLLTDPANADFTLGAGSPCFNTGLKPSSDIGLP